VALLRSFAFLQFFKRAAKIALDLNIKKMLLNEEETRMVKGIKVELNRSIKGKIRLAVSLENVHSNTVSIKVSFKKAVSLLDVTGTQSLKIKYGE